MNSNANTRRSDDGGYILVALLVGIAIAAVWMGALLPAWRQQVMREREAELIFRGEQYGRAIWLYSQKNGNQFPQNLDDLVSQHFLRKKWKDPITDDDFAILPAAFCATAAPGGVPGGAVPGRGAPAPGGGATPGRAGPFGVTPAPGGSVPAPGLTGGGPVAPGGGVPVPPRGTVPPGTIGGAAGQPGICGVTSKSEKQSIKIYQQQQQYNLWRFTMLIAQQQFFQNRQKFLGNVAPPGQMPGAPVQRGQPGRQGQPNVPGGFTPGGPGRAPGFPGPFGVPPSGQPAPPPGPGRGRG
jgi:type II secretory pathway pseudopilin PulG